MQRNKKKHVKVAKINFIFGLSLLVLFAATTAMSEQLFSCDFEVFGVVQGVFFRKYTQKKAITEGIRGWCRNTREGTVKGQMEGPAPHINEMKDWLQRTGSPSSRIDKAVFSELKPISTYTYQKFDIKH